MPTTLRRFVHGRIRALVTVATMTLGCGGLGTASSAEETVGPPQDANILDSVPEAAWTELAEARCEAWARCNCSEPPSFEECVDDFEAAYIAEYSGLALEFNQTCFDELLDFYGSTNCTSAVELLADRPACQLLAGSSTNTCQTIGQFGFTANTCRWGLSCRSGVCTNDPGPVLTVRELGDACEADSGPASPPSVCGVGLFCDPIAHVCAAQRAEGDDCLGHETCGDGLFCAGLQTSASGTCRSRISIGSECLGESGFQVCEDYCPLGESAPCQAVECVAEFCDAPGPHVCESSTLEPGPVGESRGYVSR